MRRPKEKENPGRAWPSTTGRNELVKSLAKKEDNWVPEEKKKGGERNVCGLARKEEGSADLRDDDRFVIVREKADRRKGGGTYRLLSPKDRLSPTGRRA